jgi:hypothetical protein
MFVGAGRCGMKPSDAIRLPWAGRMMPHATLDLLRDCNLSCEGCYNAAGGMRAKSRVHLREELGRLMELRRLHTLTLTGGEPLLHPELDDVIRDVKSCGLRTVLLTNGVLFDASRARQLKVAGLDMVMLHIQQRQNRPDIAAEGVASAFCSLRREKAYDAVSAGLDVGFSLLMYPDEDGQRETRALVSEMIASTTVHFLFVCPYTDFGAFSGATGNLTGGYRLPQISCPRPTSGQVSEQGAALYTILKEAGFGLFSWVGSSADADEPRWSAWGSGVLQNESGIRAFPFRPAWSDRLLLRLPRLLTGRHVFYSPGTVARFRLQLALNLFGGKGWRTSLPLLAGSFRRGWQLFQKHVVVELPPAVAADGTLIICRECPDATLHDGRLSPPCLADRMVPQQSVPFVANFPQR